MPWSVPVLLKEASASSVVRSPVAPYRSKMKAWSEPEPLTTMMTSGTLIAGEVFGLPDVGWNERGAHVHVQVDVGVEVHLTGIRQGQRYPRARPRRPSPPCEDGDLGHPVGVHVGDRMLTEAADLVVALSQPAQ